MSERENISFRAGGRLKPEGALFEVSLSVGLVGLELGLAGGRLFPASRIASIGARLMTFKAFKDIRFDCGRMCARSSGGMGGRHGTLA
jgi:hypothetical protein